MLRKQATEDYYTEERQILLLNLFETLSSIDLYIYQMAEVSPNLQIEIKHMKYER
jgi:hypothetical protein